MTHNRTCLESILAAVDAKDTAAFVDFLHPECIFRYGNMPPVFGKQAITDLLHVFFRSIAGIRHTIAQSWAIEDKLLCHGSVTYWKLDHTPLTVPFANVLTLSGEGIREYLIFVDASGLRQ